MDNFNEYFAHANKSNEFKRDEFIAQSKENRQKCYSMADDMAKSLLTLPSSLQQYLDVQSQFPKYSVNNALIIMAQNPNATQIGDLHYWREKNLYIKKAEFNNPMLILEPGDEYQRKDGTTGTYYNAKKVYDASQINANIKPSQAKYNINELVMALANKSPVAFKTVESEALPNGVSMLYDPKNNQINMTNQFGNGNTVFQLTAMEISHAIMSKGNPQYNRDDNHLTAYCASYMLCKEYGVDTKGFEFDFTLGHENMEPAEVKKELNQIKRIANEISNRIEPALAKTKADKSMER